MLSDLVRYLQGRSLLLWGYGAEGVSSLRFLQKHLPEQPVVIADAKLDQVRSAVAGLEGVEVWSESMALARLMEFDLVLKSPGISLAPLKLPPGTRDKIRGQADLFLQFAPGRIIGVTGTKGKSTTASLIAHLLNSPEKPMPVVGNIGVPPWEIIERLSADSSCVIELSSYQLDGARFSPSMAVLLNLFQEHLNYHGSIEAYWSAKWNIARYLKPGQVLVYNGCCSPILDHLAQLPEGVRTVDFTEPSSPSFSLAECPSLRGPHNQLNVQAAARVAVLSGISESLIRQRLRSFQGLPHRLEFVGLHRGVSYYNDSISTVPESALAALEALPETTTIILGGQNRGVDYRALAQTLRDSRLTSIILVSETGSILQELLVGDNRVAWVNHLSEAVALARTQTPSGGVCLFSPAAPSYNQFRNFEERGYLFRSLVCSPVE